MKAIMACDSNFGIGKDGSLPWPKNKDDLQEFKNLTSGHVVIMGSKTWNDPVFPKPLPNRKNYVLTRDRGYFDNRCLVVNDNHLQTVETIIDECQIDGVDVWVIGGKEMLEMLLPYITEFHLTVFDKNFECDRFIKNPLDYGFSELEAIKREDSTKYIFVK